MCARHFQFFLVTFSTRAPINISEILKERHSRKNYQFFSYKGMCSIKLIYKMTPNIGTSKCQREADSLYQPVNRMGRAVSACTVWWFEAKPPWRTSSSLCCCHSHISASHKQIQLRNEGDIHKSSNTAMTQELFQLCRVKTLLTH